MAKDYRDQFLGNRASESADTAWVGYYHPYASPHEIGFEMHRYGENAKMADGDGGIFLGNRELELDEISRPCCHRPYTTPPVTVLQMDARFSS